ncbi:Ig-like domain-containing protein [Flavobacterium sp.]|uniref:T9SS type A sorting domain-containing protein n=1 Tax=Flavobacterium sp. TaxID=239 RepID=UPI00286C2A2A|nr:Ig-like domain-containing protein [Flavobacterium sp.]
MKKHNLFLIAFFIFFNVDAHNQFPENKLETEPTSLIVVPTFNQVGAICWGSFLDDLPTTSTNGINGTWFPAINSEQTTTYIFTPDIGQDATTTSMTIIVKPLLAPTVTCGTWSPNQKTFDWMPVVGATTYAITYAINGGPYINAGFGAMLTYTISGVLQTDDIEILVVPSGSFGNCFTAGILNCQGAPCPEAGNSGSITVCDSNATVINLFDIITNEDSGGTWTEVSGNGGTFNAALGTYTTAIGATTSSFMYTVAGTIPCPNDSSIATIVIHPYPIAGTLSGNQNICVGFTTSFTSTAPGGVWTTSDSSIATVNNLTGVVTGNAAGVATITYTMIGIAPCSNATANRTVNVSAAPNAGVITGFQNICIGSETTFTSTITEGTWSSANPAVATVNATSGLVTGISAGTAIITYTQTGTGGCSNATASRLIIVGPDVAVTTNLFCDPSNVTSPNSVAVDWSAVPGAINYQFSYYINGLLVGSGMTSVSHYEIFGVLSGQTVTFTLTNVAGISCFQSTSITCSNLANASFETDTFKSFPNPVNNVLNLTSSNTINNVVIINALGQYISNKSYDSKSIQIDMSNLMSGIYMIKASSNNKTKTIKIIKD